MELIAPFLVIFSNLRPERDEHISRFLTTFTNLGFENNELIARFLTIFTNLRPVRVNLRPDLWLFSRN